jgi:hypothetical protein
MLGPGCRLCGALRLGHDLDQDLAHDALHAVKARGDPREQFEDLLSFWVAIHGA